MIKIYFGSLNKFRVVLFVSKIPGKLKKGKEYENENFINFYLNFTA